MGAPANDAVRTYRFLRLAIVALVVLLAASVAIDWLAVGRDCWERSISDYHHTPARSVFVASVVAAGVCMIVLKGVTEVEDVLLNLAGMLAGVVAFVPTSEPSTCRPGVAGTGDGTPAVENNVWALLAAGVAGLLIAFLTRRRSGLAPHAAAAHRVGLLSALGVLVALAAWFLLGRESFVAHAHYVSAVVMFACIVAVVVVNARGVDLARGIDGPTCGARNRYTVIAAAMVVSVVGVGGAGLLTGWEHTVLWVEALVLGLFATFWALQTHELWDHGVRPRLDRAP
ncbi:hypothetical protein ACHAAC_04305 [Aeromicrobium sp. CF4.19]|uniref:hypothetical protein n=1 Tax=Aeromicrobium sp. CF4.19 TaxID=3373082 RepID=UPI003EE57FB6